MKKVNLDFFLSKPYRLAVCIATPLFLYIFLVAFLPFGIHNYNPRFTYTVHFLVEMAKFGTSTFFLCVLMEFWVKRHCIKRASTAAVVYWHLALLLVLGLSNFVLYNLIGGWHDWKFISGLRFVLQISSVLIFPLAGVLGYFRFRNLKSDYEQMLTNREEGPKEEFISVKGSGNNESVAVRLVDLLCLKAHDNYVELSFLEQNQVKKKLVRGTLTNIFRQISHPEVVRCHRSYVVNLHNVRSVVGHSSIELRLVCVSHPIPVSRSYREVVLQAIRRFKIIH
ncbi:LytTR family DNA-binding domain-containing protein [Roseivirga sp. UBA838]|uniref:LytR/AlgR family response regulator transcription factor n=1 Tax=Roseivirga sp. UBA838 TaxID=1947393 RepID=UPI00257AAF46|nr:LytTR family DNA-binding domain-containing protein [Roseivirga sp. UBA838]|tara:strand:+ start:6051 stop:6893 length:843 start_codon:yes stop_codon:yes gene_type:complete